MGTGGFRRALTAAGILAGAMSAMFADATETTALSETWENGSLGVINPAGGTITIGNTFSADNTWTVDAATQSSGIGAHMSVEIVQLGGSKWLHWQSDELDDDPDVQDFYAAPLDSTFDLADVQSFTYSFDFIPTVVNTGGRRSSTFYVGAGVNNCYRFQINVRSAASELIEVAAIVGGVSNPLLFGAPTNFGPGAIEIDNEYNFTVTIVPGATQTTFTCAVRDSGNNIIQAGSGAFVAGVMVPLSTTVDYFAMRARNRTFHIWDNLLLEFTTPTPPGAQPVITPGSGMYQAGDTIIMSAPSGGTGYQWYRNNVAMSNDVRTSGVSTGLVTITPAITGDSATYTVTYNDGVNNVVTLPYYLHVFPAGPLPLLGTAGIAVLGVLLTLGAVVYTTRRRRSA